MNIEDEQEYEEFYDFSKTYEGYANIAGLIKESGNAIKEGGEDGVKAVADEWEDIDLEDADEEEVK